MPPVEYRRKEISPIESQALTDLVFFDQLYSLVAIFPVSFGFARISNDLKAFGFELETQAKISLMSIGVDDHKAGCDLR